MTKFKLTKISDTLYLIDKIVDNMLRPLFSYDQKFPTEAAARTWAKECGYKLSN